MTAVHIGRFQVDTPEWHAARADGLGGSEVAAVLGLSPHTSAFALWHAKTGQYHADPDNDEVRAGTRLEPVILDWIAEQHPGWTMRRDLGTFRHETREWQIANPDGMLWDADGRRRLVEAKFALYPDQWGEPGTDEVPIYYRCQVQWYLDVFGLDLCHLGVFIGACAEFREYEIHAHEGDQGTLRDRGLAFMETIWNNQRPDIDGHSATYDVVKAMHPDIEPVSVEVDADLVRAYCDAKNAEKDAVAESKRQSARVADVIGNAQRATYMGKPFADRRVKGGGVPYLQAARVLPFGPSPTIQEKAAS